MSRRLLVIIPCYNEAASIGVLLQEMLCLPAPSPWSIEILVVNDCSRDNTYSVVKSYPVHVLDLPVNLGIGGAMQAGYKYALRNSYDFAVQMDGDGQHPPAELAKLLQFYDEHPHNVVIGSRFIHKEGFQSSGLRRAGIKYFHWLNKLFTGKSIYDSTSGFRMFDRQAITVAASYYPDEYPEPESLVSFSRAGLTIAEVPVIMRERQGGVSSIRHFNTVYYCVKVTLAMFFSYIRK